PRAREQRSIVGEGQAPGLVVRGALEELGLLDPERAIGGEIGRVPALEHLEPEPELEPLPARSLHEQLEQPELGVVVLGLTVLLSRTHGVALEELAGELGRRELRSVAETNGADRTRGAGHHVLGHRRLWRRPTPFRRGLGRGSGARWQRLGRRRGCGGTTTKEPGERERTPTRGADARVKQGKASSVGSQGL